MFKIHGNFTLADRIVSMLQRAVPLRGVILAAGCAVALLACVPYVSDSAIARETYLQFAKRIGGTAPAGSSFRNDLENQLVAAANRYRASKGQKALKSSRDFLLAARAQAADMALNNFVGHRSSHGEEFSSRMSAMLGGGMLMMPHMAENAARDSKAEGAGGERAKRLMTQWIESPPHRKALLNSGFKYVATGVVERGGKAYAVQIFWGDLPAGVKVQGAVPAESDKAESSPSGEDGLY